jgi:hypothetical protein
MWKNLSHLMKIYIILVFMNNLFGTFNNNDKYKHTYHTFLKKLLDTLLD